MQNRIKCRIIQWISKSGNNSSSSNQRCGCNYSGLSSIMPDAMVNIDSKISYTFSLQSLKCIKNWLECAFWRNYNFVMMYNIIQGFYLKKKYNIHTLQNEHKWNIWRKGIRKGVWIYSIRISIRVLKLHLVELFIFKGDLNQIF